MKKLLKAIGVLALLLVAILCGALLYVKTALPRVGEAQNIKVEHTQERVERGRYLANCVTVCMDCHSTRDWTLFSGPIKPGTLGMGGEKFDRQYGFPGVYFSKNITPAGIREYTDGELLRVITTGVDRKGRAMFPVMPYHYYGRMDTEDILSIIAYLRTLPALENKVPDSQSDFPMSLIINTLPTKASPQKRPAMSDSLAYGHYLVNAAGCAECHTPVKQGQIIQELMYYGGREFSMGPMGVVRSANITPDAETGIGNWSREFFVARFRSYSDSVDYQQQKVEPGMMQSVMPWTMYANMTEQDLNAMYTYLMSLKGMPNKVLKFEPGGAAAKEY
jgi:hypothetical protein